MILKLSARKPGVSPALFSFYFFRFSDTLSSSLSLSLSLSLNTTLLSPPPPPPMQHPRRHQEPLLPPASSATTTPVSASSDFKRGKKRGSYNCGRCGLPKKGHVCHLGPTDDEDDAAAATPADSSSAVSSLSAKPLPPPQPPRQPFSHLRRALSFDDDDADGGGFDAPAERDDGDDCDGGDEFFSADLVAGGLPASCMWEVLRRLPPAGLLSAAMVCKGWRATTRRLWRAAEVLRLRVPARAQVGLVASVLHKCPGLVSLSLRMERY